LNRFTAVDIQVGGTAFVVLVAVAVWFFVLRKRCRRRRHSTPKNDSLDTFEINDGNDDVDPYTGEQWQMDPINHFRSGTL
jgi:cbb3-type cytochrome oxidase subunit 3